MRQLLKTALLLGLVLTDAAAAQNAEPIMPETIREPGPVVEWPGEVMVPQTLEPEPQDMRQFPQTIREPGPVGEVPQAVRDPSLFSEPLRQDRPAINYDEMLARVAEQQGEAPPPGLDITLTGPSRGSPPAGAGLAYTSDPELRAVLGRALYEDHLHALEYNRRVFEWQMTSTRISFWVVIGLVLAGLIFAAIQFARAMRAPGPGEDMTTDLEISGKGIKISSPVIGLVVLALSLGFFYLYLRHVYPIEYARNAEPRAPVAETE